MTVQELIKALQDLGYQSLQKEILLETDEYITTLNSIETDVDTVLLRDI